MGLNTSDAIVLRRYPFRETSLIVSCLTRDFGKVKGLIKGIRTSSNRFRSSMEPMTENRIVFYDTRSSQLHLISQCELVQAFDAIVQDYDAAQLAAFCLELTDAVVPLEEPCVPVYRLLEETLGQIALGQRAVEELRVHFIARLLRLIGFNPQIDACVGCGEQIRGEAYWSLQQGGLLSAGCLHLDLRAQRVESAMVDALIEFAEDHYPPHLDKALLRQLHQHLDEFLQWRIEVPLKTVKRVQTHV